MIDAKLSSSKTMSAASLATSVPRIPMARPTWACLRAGASLTPSPVMATTSPVPSRPPSCWYACTITCLWIGETRAKTQVFVTQVCQNSMIAVSCSCSKKSSPLGIILSIWDPVTAVNLSFSSGAIPSRRAMALAVSGWSPVTMITRTPAWWAAVTASRTPSLGGSSIPMSPQKLSPVLRSKFRLSSLLPSKACPAGSWTVLVAKHSTRRPSDISSWSMVSNFLLCCGVISSAPHLAHKSSTRSGAPFTITLYGRLSAL
mmetsp:Transcript_108133/g.247983  ORF Transcript_108133/g.247983 Transcript_108133/m.247983 type:complete len:259 (-) Transcript_108133:1662-2438(-)